MESGCIVYIFNRPEHFGGWASGRQDSERLYCLCCDKLSILDLWICCLEMTRRLKLSQTIPVCKTSPLRKWFVFKASLLLTKNILPLLSQKNLKCWMQWYLKIQQNSNQHSGICKVFTADGTSLHVRWINGGGVFNVHSVMLSFPFFRVFKCSSYVKRDILQ